MKEQLPDDYFLDTTTDMLEYLEQQGYSSLKETSESIIRIRDKAFKILDILIVGMGAALLLLFQGEYPKEVYFSLAAFVLTWALIAIYITNNFVRSIIRHSSYNSPELLYNQTFKKNDAKKKHLILRRYELHNISSTINEMSALNISLCTKLNRAVTCIALSPLVLFFVYVVILSWVRYHQ